MLQELLGMGFGEARAARGLHFSGNISIEGAINWLAEHEGDADLDEPLLVPKVRPARQTVCLLVFCVMGDCCATALCS
jgi:uncharacterized UBP type Zn finger protein